MPPVLPVCHIPIAFPTHLSHQPASRELLEVWESERVAKEPISGHRLCRAIMAPTGLLESFLGAIQASLSVLLVILYGGIAAWLGILNSGNTKAVSKICVRMFLPALLVTQIGSELHQKSASRYVVILLWALLCHLASFLLGIMAHIGLGMPDWTTVALMFNNTTSYPLLLIAALRDTGILKALIVADETTQEAIERAKSYFLIFATVSSCLTFAVGPRLIDSEHAPDEDDKQSAPSSGEILDHNDTEIVDESSQLLPSNQTQSSVDGPYIRNSFFPSRRHSLSSPSQRQSVSLDTRSAYLVTRRSWQRLGPRAQWWLLLISDFFNAPLIGALLGAVIGLVPMLHKAFFNDTTDGGIFTAWFTASLRNIGGLFVPLPVVIAGVSLYTAMQQPKAQGSQAAKTLPWAPTIFILGIRFIIWPVASITCVYLMASRTSILGDDPMLWFTLMLMPTGPPAMKLITLVQVSDAGEEDETSIAKLLTISYLISPVLSLTVVGGLKATQMAMH
ncbi:uncharacterized protein E0L32_002807 [Thyridium curvatum]|uniref:Auxin efflux carrier n=1 Tax=Thyridium curvatum TaxID=1093900 RepID=A0A507BEG7_9PEZI|nr:uncharacterized protein E0L32_002807 [Thyridium curvatum]TPX17706.1 hypothetical protein E0L32_002807 [Thyridium curvatum]